jgi:hypothetical protein
MNIFIYLNLLTANKYPNVECEKLKEMAPHRLKHTPNKRIYHYESQGQSNCTRETFTTTSKIDLA